MLSYCLKCRKNTEGKNPKNCKEKVRRTILLSTCEVIESKKCTFIKEEEAGGLSSTLGIKTLFRKISVVALPLI